MWKLLRWISTLIFVLVIIPIISVNVENLAQAQGWGGFLVAWWPQMTDFISWADQTSIYVFAAFVGGVSAALWVVRIYPEQSPATTSSPTVIDYERPTYSLYDGRDRFSVLEASFLWGDITPNTNPVVLSMFPEAMASYRLLSEAIQDDKLPCFTVGKDGKVKTKTTDPKPSWVVKRSDLLGFANQIDNKPRFLFPNSRSWMA